MSSPGAYAERFLSETRELISKLDPLAVTKAVDILEDAWKRGTTVFVAGNGGSASTATHFACDLDKWACQDAPKRLRAFSLVDNIPLVSALTNDNGFAEVYTEQLENFWRSGDVFVGISVHGGSGRDRAGAWSQNLLRAAYYAKEHGGKLVALVGFDGGALHALADASILVPAESTPQVEGIHLVITHLLADELRRRITPPEKLGLRK